MQATYTKGPLHYGRHATPDYAPQFGIYKEGEHCRDFVIVSGENAEADAMLFAAAPDMLHVLKYLIENPHAMLALQRVVDDTGQHIAGLARDAYYKAVQS